MTDDLSRLDVPPAPDRRDFVAAAVLAGFAAAVQPVTADTVITTDTKGIAVGEAKIPVGKETIPGYYARPNYYDGGDDAVSYCLSRFKSYDPESGTYLGFDGVRHPCP